MYCGIPIGRDAFAIARRVLKEEGIDVSHLDDVSAKNSAKKLSGKKKK
jgi:hypothetical protein